MDRNTLAFLRKAGILDAPEAIKYLMGAVGQLKALVRLLIRREQAKDKVRKKQRRLRINAKKGTNNG